MIHRSNAFAHISQLRFKIIDFYKLDRLRLYGTPCNIFNDDRIKKNDYNHGFKHFKIYNICPKNAFIKFNKRDKK